MGLRTEPIPTIVDKFPEPMGEDVEGELKCKNHGEEKVENI
jgi:hypothetical protein